MFLHFSGLRKTGLPEITVDELYERMDSDRPPLLIDIRSPEEFNGMDELTKYGHIPDVKSIPILELESAPEGFAAYRDRPVVTMCPGGGLSLVAIEIMAGAGFTDVKSLQGGTDLWHEKGYPTTTA